MQPEQYRAGKGEARTKLKVSAWGLLTLLAIALGLAVRPTGGNPTVTAERNQTVPVPERAPVRPAPAQVAGQQGVAARKFPPAVAAAAQDVEHKRDALLKAMALDDSMEQYAALNRCLEGMTPEMAATLLTSLNPADLKGEGAQRLFDHWATANPREAIEWAQAQGDPVIHQSFLTVAAMRWAVTDLNKATAWASNLPEGDERTEIMAAVGSEAVRSDPLAALHMGLDLPESPAQSNLVLRAVAEWAATDPNKAVAWSEHIKDKDLRQRVTEQIVVASADADPMSAVTLAVDQMTPGVEQDRALVAIVQRWVQTNPVQASSFVSQLPDDSLGRDAMDNLVNLWAARDKLASGKWLLTLPEGELQDVGFLTYTRVLGQTSDKN